MTSTELAAVLARIDERTNNTHALVEAMAKREEHRDDRLTALEVATGTQQGLRKFFFGGSAGVGLAGVAYFILQVLGLLPKGF